MQSVSRDQQKVVTASTITSLNYTITEGSLIHATFESAANSDLPGYVRAIVSEPSYSEDGTATI
jgi:type IV secretion system protein VirB10